MKKFILLLCLSLIIALSSFSQEIRKDPRPQILKEDVLNKHKSHKINDLDLIQALEIAGIGIHKFDIGDFDKKYNLYYLVEEYKDSNLVNTDTLFAYHNQYHYFKMGEKDFYNDFIDQIKIFTEKKEEENKLALHFKTYQISFEREIDYKKTSDKQFFRIRDYTNTEWQLNKNVPLLIFASSWYDKRIDSHRFCGVINLSANDKETKRLLSSSPQYYVVSYKITEIN